MKSKQTKNDNISNSNTAKKEKTVKTAETVEKQQFNEEISVLEAIKQDKAAKAMLDEKKPQKRISAETKQTKLINSAKAVNQTEEKTVPEKKTSRKVKTKTKILFAASEAAPFVKTGGLGDVMDGLPIQLAEDCDVRVIIPLYEVIDGKWREKMQYIGNINVNLAWRNLYCGLFSLKQNGITYYFIDNEYYFKRREVYGAFDDAERFAFFSKAVLDVLHLLEFAPDIIHCNDWQTALIPLYLRTLYRNDYFLQNVKTVFTIHNIQYQGRFTGMILGDILGLGADSGQGDALEFYKDVNLMKGGICFADYVTTVSPTYAGEVQNPYYAYGLDGILASNSHKLRGILNGINTEVYNPETDPHLFKSYNTANISDKEENKTALLKLLGLREAGENTPVIGVVSRLVAPKGIDLIAEALDELMKEDIRLVILGTGDWQYEQLFKNAAHRFEGKMSANIMFSNDLANKIYAGSDIILMPSKTEPCGLSQMIALRYGAIPLVRETGGLKDTIKPYNEFTGEGNGFSFANYNSYDMLHVIRRAIGFYRDKNVWNKLVKNALSGDYSWKNSAEEYKNIYNSLLGR